jgi:hypothetical protein
MRKQARVVGVPVDLIFYAKTEELSTLSQPELDAAITSSLKKVLARFS